MYSVNRNLNRLTHNKIARASQALHLKRPRAHARLGGPVNTVQNGKKKKKEEGDENRTRGFKHAVSAAAAAAPAAAARAAASRTRAHREEITFSEFSLSFSLSSCFFLLVLGSKRWRQKLSCATNLLYRSHRFLQTRKFRRDRPAASLLERFYLAFCLSRTPSFPLCLRGRFVSRIDSGSNRIGFMKRFSSVVLTTSCPVRHVTGPWPPLWCLTVS